MDRDKLHVTVFDAKGDSDNPESVFHKVITAADFGDDMSKYATLRSYPGADFKENENKRRTVHNRIAQNFLRSLKEGGWQFGNEKSIKTLTELLVRFAP